jgi:hypothetical protein
VSIKLDIYHWIDTSAGRLLVPEGVIRPVVRDSAMTLFIIYIFYRILRFLNHVIIIKINILFPQA